MASSATSATSFELIEDQTLTVEEVEMASQEAQDIRTREAAVAAGLALDEPEAPPSASATDVMKDLSSALERLRVAFATPTPDPPKAAEGTISPHGGQQAPVPEAEGRPTSLGSRPVSASDNPEVRTPTQPAGREVELRGETLPLQPWARHCMEISDRPTTLPITHDPNLSDKVMYLQMAFKQRPLRDGGGKPSLGRLAPWTRPLSKAAAMGAKICVLTSPWGDKLQESLSLGDGSHPFPEHLLEDIREILVPGAGRPAEGQPFFLDILHSLALNIQDPDHQFLWDLEQGVLLGVTDPPLASPGIWPLKKELKGEEPEFQKLIPRARVTTPQRITSVSSSVAHSWRRSPWAW